jgi:hypothetical protein
MKHQLIVIKKGLKNKKKKNNSLMYSGLSFNCSRYKKSDTISQIPIKKGTILNANFNHFTVLSMQSGL